MEISWCASIFNAWETQMRLGCILQ